MRNHPTNPDCPCAFPLHGPQLPDRAQSLPFGWLVCTGSHPQQAEELTQHRQSVCIKDEEKKVRCLYLVVLFLRHIFRLFQSITSQQNLCVTPNCSSTI